MTNGIKAVTVKAIKALGMSARWDSEWQEFIVDYLKSDPRRTENTAYHCSDRWDAYDTAVSMSKFNTGQEGR